jgi:acetylornithine deacetylase
MIPFTHHLCSYIETPSVTNQPNGDLVSLLNTWFTKANWSTLTLESSSNPGLLNFVAHIGPLENQLVINSHTDTISPVAEDWFNNAPFTLDHQDGFYFGNGAVDTKGPTVAAILSATQEIDPGKLKRGISFWLNHSEENAIGGVLLKGSREMVDWARREGQRPAAMIVVEPTVLTPVYAHNGYATVAIETRGLAAHSSVPETGENAIEKMSAAIGLLQTLRDQLRSEFDIPLNIGHIQGGREDQVNVVAETCRMLVDFRCPPNTLTAEEVLTRIERILPEGTTCKFHIETIPPFYCAPTKPIVQLAARITGKEPEQVGYYADAAIYKGLMEDGLLSDGMLILGCGDIRFAHRPNEKIGHAEMEQGIAVFTELITNYCC